MTEPKAFKSDLKIPKFSTEAEEAKWWFENDDLILKEFQKAAKEGRLATVAFDAFLLERGIRSRSRSPHQPLRFVSIRTT